MGTTYSSDWQTRTDMRDYLREALTGSGNAIKKDALVGNHYYAAVTDKSGATTVFVALLSKYDGSYGYKDMDESCGPYVYDCPLVVLNAADPDETIDSEWARTWRQKVREYHVQQSERRRAKTQIRPGVSVTTRTGETYLVESYGPRYGYRRKVLVGRDEQGGVWRIPVNRVVSVAE